eukprot:256123_1
MAAPSADYGDISRPPTGGYDLEIFVEKDKIEQYICQICQHISRDCVEVSCGNGHIYCNSCIRYNFKINGHSCPADRAKNITITANDFVRRKILASNVKCKHHKFHCEWVGALRQFDHHVMHCKYKPIKCKYCKNSISSQMVSEHYAECDEYLVRCSWCNNMYRRKILNEHIDTCYMKPITCPNGCNQRIVRNKLNKHIAEQCNERMIHCSFHKFGCNDKIKHKDMHQHNTNMQLQHLQYQMTWILLENDNKTKQIAQLKCHISQLEAPDILLVEGSCIQPMNGIYKKYINSMENYMEDEKKQNERINMHNISERAFYKKYDKTQWILYYNSTRNEWIFSCNGFNVDTNEYDACCNDNAITPLNIVNKAWNIWKQNKYEVTNTLKITEIDLFQELLNHKRQNDNNKPIDNNIRFSDVQKPLFHVDETKSAVLNPSFIPNDDDKDDHELIPSNSNHKNNRKRTMSNASNVSNTSNASSSSSTSAESESSHHSNDDETRERPNIRLNVHNNNNIYDKWSISVAVKTKYDALYDDLLRREADSNHENPFGPPMVSNETLYKYLTSVGYDSDLIKILWKLINIPNNDTLNTHTNVNNLLTRNGFVAICHLLDKITNNNYNIPDALPTSLQPQSLNNLISTPMHNETLNNTVFPNITDENENDIKQNIEIVSNNNENNNNINRENQNQSGLLLPFNNNSIAKQNENELNLEDVFEFNDIIEYREEESKQDFLTFTPNNAKNKQKHNGVNYNYGNTLNALNVNDTGNDNGLLIMESETGSTPNPSTTNTHMLPMLDFMNNRSRTKPNTPRNDNDNNDIFLNVFPPQNVLIKSKSWDDKHNNHIDLKSKSTNDIFNVNNIGPSNMIQHRSLNIIKPSMRNNNNNNN